MTAVGLYGGTFDPVHYGHLAAARAAIDQFHLERLYVVPVFQPPHRVGTEASFAHRLAMARLAFADWPEVVVSDLERERGGISYTIDSAEAIERLHPEAQVYLLVGADAADEMISWKDPRRLALLVRLLVAPRTGYSLKPDAGWRCDRIVMERVDVSATKVRAAVKSGASIAEWVPPAVAEYIIRHLLYRGG